MKAKEYAQEIIDAKYSNDSLRIFINKLIKEIPALIKTRNCQTNSAINSVFKEIDQKYRATCKIINQERSVLNVEGFKKLTQDLYSDVPNINELNYFKTK